MTTPQVGQGAVAIFPTFKGFRRGVVGEVDGATRESASRFTKGFSAAGTTAGRGFSDGFKKQTANVSADALKKATDEVAKATRELSAARLKELDATGKVRVAEAQLADVRKRYADDSAQVVRAQERLAAAQRGVLNIQESVENSTERLSRAQRDLADASQLAAAGGGRSFRNAFGLFGGQAADGFTSQFRSRVGEIFTGNFLAGIALSVGRSVLQGAVTGIQAGVQFAFQGIQLASDLGESINAVNVSFGEEIGAQLEILAQDAPQRLALSRRAFLQFGTQFSAFAKTIRRDNPAQFIDEITERGADFASVFNLEVADALQLFQSGLAGETEPLRRYGLDLSAASVEAFAYANGIAESGRALTETEKVQARYGLLLQQTSATQGDNANTAGELAGQQRRLKTAFEETQTRLGEFLIPGFLDLVTIANRDLLPAFGEIIDRVGPELGAALEGVDWQGFADDIAPSIERIGELTAEQGIPNLISLLENVARLAPIALESANQDLEDFNDLLNIFDGDWSRLREDNAWLAEIGIVLADGEILFGDAGRDFMEQLELGVLDAAGGPQGAVAATLRGMRTAAVRETEIGLRRGGGGSFDAGVNFGEGLAAGIDDTASKVGAAARRIARTAVGQIRGELAIASPSKVTRDLGRFTGDGFVEGLKDKESEVAASARALVSGFQSAAVTPVGAGSASSVGPGDTTIILQGTDPFVLMAMLQQELDGSLRAGG